MIDGEEDYFIDEIPSDYAGKREYESSCDEPAYSMCGSYTKCNNAEGCVGCDGEPTDPEDYVF